MKSMMNLRERKSQCDYCFRPASDRLSNREVKEKYECYAESYIKCFWGLCDHQTSSHSLVTKSQGHVITKQPQLQKPFETTIMSKDVIEVAS